MKKIFTRENLVIGMLVIAALTCLGVVTYMFWRSGILLPLTITLTVSPIIGALTTKIIEK